MVGTGGAQIEGDTDIREGKHLSSVLVFKKVNVMKLYRNKREDAQRKSKPQCEIQFVTLRQSIAVDVWSWQKRKHELKGE